MMNFVQLIPVMICVFRLVKWRLHVKSWVTGFLIVLFVFRCKEFYPFSHWHNVQCDVIAAWLIGLLVHFFAADSNDIPTIWSLVYLSSIVLERIFNGHFDLNVTLYWKTEAILLALVFLREGLVTRFVKRSETIV